MSEKVDKNSDEQIERIIKRITKLSEEEKERAIKRAAEILKNWFANDTYVGHKSNTRCYAPLRRGFLISSFNFNSIISRGND